MTLKHLNLNMTHLCYLFHVVVCGAFLSYPSMKVMAGYAVIFLPSPLEQLLFCVQFPFKFAQCVFGNNLQKADKYSQDLASICARMAPLLQKQGSAQAQTKQHVLSVGTAQPGHRIPQLSCLVPADLCTQGGYAGSSACPVSMAYTAPANRSWSYSL